MSDDKPEHFVSTATIYKSGAGEPFPPGTPVPLQADQAGGFRAAGLEAKPEGKKAEGGQTSQGGKK